MPLVDSPGAIVKRGLWLKIGGLSAAVDSPVMTLYS